MKHSFRIVIFYFLVYLPLGTPFPCIVGHLLARQSRRKRSVRRFGAAPFASPNERVPEGRSCYWSQQPAAAPCV